MATYYYNTFVTKPCLPYIADQVLNTGIGTGVIPGMTWNDTTSTLSVHWDIDLSLPDKALLDSIVEGSDGLVEVCKSRQSIMSELFWRAQKPDQIGRFIGAIDNMCSFLVCLDNYNYTYALSRAQQSLADGDITQEDFDLIADVVPSARFILGE